MNRHLLLAGLEEVRANWGWFLVLGIALAVLGVYALGAAWLSTLVSVLLLGWLLVFGGVFEAIVSFKARPWSGFLLHLFVSLLYVVCGILLLVHPVVSAAGLTLVLAALFLTGGLFRIITAATHRYGSWGWAIFDGAVTMLVGALIWRAWPSSAVWVLGTFLGIVLICRGWAWIMFALAARKLRRLSDRDTTEVFRPAA